MTPGGGIRTHDQGIMSPRERNAKPLNPIDLAASGTERAQLAHKSGATVGSSTIRDRRLLALVEAWETLPEALKVGILAMQASHPQGLTVASDSESRCTGSGK